MNYKIYYLIVNLLLIASLSIAYATDIYVFYPTDIRPKSLQGKINHLCPDIKTIAFGRVVDFYRQIEQLPPQAIISLSPVIVRNDKYNADLKGSRQGQYEEDYVLISLDQPVDLTQIAQLKIGVLDILGRKPMKQFMNDLFHKKVKIKRVIKTEDFLPLLTFKLADAIFVSKTTYKKLQAKSKQNLIATETGIRLGLAVTGVQQQNKKISQCIKQFDSSTNTLLGVDYWEARR